MPELTIPLSGQDLTKKYEGWRDKIYTDTKGNPSIGWGFNLNDKRVSSLIPKEVRLGKRPLTTEEAQPVFDTLYDNAYKDAVNFTGEDTFNTLNPIQQNIIVDMSYNLGLNKLSGFKELKKAIQKGDTKKAISEMKNSNWYKQVGNRAKEHIKNFVTPYQEENIPQLFGGQPVTFGEAFKNAKQSGLNEFEWNSNKYNTKLKGY